MTLDELKNFDPQRALSVRFGTIDDDGSVDWASWTKVRVLVTSNPEGEWYLHPMSLDGRPFPRTFEGHSGVDGIFPQAEAPVVMMVRDLREPQTLRELFEAEDRAEASEQEGFRREDFSPFGKAIFDAMFSEGSVEESFVLHMIELLENGDTSSDTASTIPSR